MERGPGTGGEAALQGAWPAIWKWRWPPWRTRYQQLVAEGYLYAEEEKPEGYLSSPRKPEEGTGRAQRRPFRLRPGLPSHAAAGIGCWTLTSGGAGTEGISLHPSWARLMRRVLTDRGSSCCAPPPQRGGGGACAGRWPAACTSSGDHGVAGAGGGGGRDGVPVWADRPAAGPGSGAMGWRTRGTPGRGRSTGSTGRGVSPLALDESGVPVEAVERPSGVQVVHLSPIPPVPQRRGHAHRPAAEPSALERRRGPGRYLIEDDYDSEFRFTGRPIPPLQNIDRAGRVDLYEHISRSLAPRCASAIWCFPRAAGAGTRGRWGFTPALCLPWSSIPLARFLSRGTSRPMSTGCGLLPGRRDQGWTPWPAVPGRALPGNGEERDSIFSSGWRRIGMTAIGPGGGGAADPAVLPVRLRRRRASCSWWSAIPGSNWPACRS